MAFTRRNLLFSAAIGMAVTAHQAGAQQQSISHRRIKANGINFHIAEQGSGPLVLLCHGFPESWYSWRHQIPALADAGYHVVAPDLRGYGQTDAPHEIASYTIMDLVGDSVGLVAALGEKRAVIVGHDMGATVAWNSALLRPDVFPAVAALSVPYRQRGPVPPLRSLREQGLNTYYWLYYQDPGVAEAEFERDPRATLRRSLYTSSGDAPRNRPDPFILQPGKGKLDSTIDPDRLPSWLTETDLDYMAADLARTGFRGPLNWYRNIDRNWELLAPWTGATILQPALFIAGTQDPVFSAATGKPAIAAMKTTVPNLKRQLTIEGAGHWIQQERPQQVTDALVQFLRSLTI